MLCCSGERYRAIMALLFFHLSPQVAEAPVLMQPAEPIHISPVSISPVSIAHYVTENVLQTSKDSGSDSEAEIWSFDRAINKVF